MFFNGKQGRINKQKGKMLEIFILCSQHKSRNTGYISKLESKNLKTLRYDNCY